MLLSLLLVGTLLATALQPEAMRPTVIMVVVALLLASVAVAALVRAGFSTRTGALVLTLSDIPLLTIGAMSTSNPGEGLASLLVPVVVAGWLCGPRQALAVGAIAAGASLAMWTFVEQWSEPRPLPDVFWILLVTSAFIFALSREMFGAIDRSRSMIVRSLEEVAAVASLRRRLVADVSHELRTPLTAMMGFVETALRDDIALTADQRHDLLVEARAGGERLSHLIEDLLEVERTSGGHARLQLQARTAGELLPRTVATVPVPSDRSVECIVSDAAMDASVQVDELRLFQIIANLVQNALKHGAGNVTVAVDVEHESLVIDVSDEGPGVPHDARELIFEAFGRADETPGSVGLGLTIARSYAIAHGGSLEYVPASSDARHAFRLRLPLAPTPAAASA